jgi:Fic family protein
MSNLVYEPEVTMLYQSNLIENETSLEALSYAIRAWDFLRAQKLMTHAVVTTAHGILMESENLTNPLAPKWQGFYRTIPVQIGGRIVPPHNIRPMLDELYQQVNDKRQVPRSDEGAARHCQRLHVAFERIHPFVDGNGRMGRMIYNWHRLRLQLPVDIINVSDRAEYYKWFEQGEKEN